MRREWFRPREPLRDNEFADRETLRDEEIERNQVDSPDELAWNDDSETFRDEQIEHYPGGSPKIRLLPSVKTLIGMAVLGVALAFVWQYSAGLLGSFAQWRATFVAQHTTRSDSQQLENQLAGVLREMETLKQSVAGLAAAQQQISENIVSLRADQQQLRERVQPASYWYSDPTKLKLHISFQSKHSTNSLPQQTSASRTPQDQKVGAHNNGAQPLSLSSASGR